MQVLTPTQAAKIASGVYGLTGDSVSNSMARGRTLGCEGMFEIEDNSRFEGTSGGMLVIKKTTGFGYIAEGTGVYSGEILLVTRGTAIGVDWLTNLNIGMQIGPGGWPVHAGFNDVWKSFKQDIDQFLRGKSPIGIHCVGHSLGGALATLNADYLSNIGAGQIKLYTFGAPRAGSFVFSRSLTNRIGNQNIYRVSHPADPVPMIPLFPFQHLPYNVSGMTIPNGNNGLISIGAHNMKKSYIPGVEGKSWNDLLSRANPNDDAETESWLKRASQSDNIFIKGSAKLLSLIGKALSWILKKILMIVKGVMGIALTVGATALDQIAYLLHQGFLLSETIAGYIVYTIKAIFKFIGKVVRSSLNITVAFLRFVLNSLYTGIINQATNAINLVF